MDKLGSIRAFHAVVKLKSFTQAALELDISPQLVSKYIAALESELGLRLLNRTTRRVNPTEEGARYYEETLRLVESLDSLESRLTDTRLNPSGLLRVSAPVSLGSHYLGGLVGRFQQSNPEVTVDIQLNDRKVDIIDEGFDLALRIGALPDSSLIARHLTGVDVVACAAPQYLHLRGVPRSDEALSQHRVLRYSYLPQSAQAEGQEAPLISNSGELLMKAAETGAGIVVIPRFIARQSLENGSLCELPQLKGARQLGLYALYPHRTLVPLKVRSFVDFLLGYFKGKTL